MALGRPVIADNSGGPMETVIPGTNGFLCNEWREYGEAMGELVVKTDLAEKLGERGRKRVEEEFSFAAFSDQLDLCVKKMKKRICLQLYVPFIFLIVLILALKY